MFDIGNYYGGLEVKEEDGKYLWGIENWDGTEFEEIPNEADTLKKINEEDKKPKDKNSIETHYSAYNDPYRWDYYDNEYWNYQQKYLPPAKPKEIVFNIYKEVKINE